MSNILGRPPSSSDVDCTVKYVSLDDSSEISSHVLDASVQIFMIIERVVVEVYSRKRISLRIANYVSHQLKNWASNWLRPLSEVARSDPTTTRREAIVGTWTYPALTYRMAPCGIEITALIKSARCAPFSNPTAELLLQSKASLILVLAQQVPARRSARTFTASCSSPGLF